MRALQAFQRVSSSLGAAQTTTVAAAILGAGSCRLRGLATTAVAREQGKVGLGAVGGPFTRYRFARGAGQGPAARVPQPVAAGGRRRRRRHSSVPTQTSTAFFAAPAARACVPGCPGPGV